MRALFARYVEVACIWSRGRRSVRAREKGSFAPLERRLSDPGEREIEAAVEGSRQMLAQPMLQQGVLLENSLTRYGIASILGILRLRASDSSGRQISQALRSGFRLAARTPPKRLKFGAKRRRPKTTHSRLGPMVAEPTASGAEGFGPKRARVAIWSEATETKKNPLPEQGARNLIGWLLVRAPHDIRGQITLGSFQEFEFNGFAFVQRAVPVFLDGGEVDEDILSG
jgi:hypothetical protein